MSSSEVQLREFSFDEDYEAVLKLWQSIEAGMAVGRSDTPSEVKKKLERDPDLFLVAELGDAIIGTVIGGFDGRRGMVYHLAVQMEFRKIGVGAQLLAEVEKRLQAKGCLRCYLLVLDDNADAIRLYENNGWIEMKHDRIFGKDFS